MKKGEVKRSIFRGWIIWTLEAQWHHFYMTEVGAIKRCHFPNLTTGNGSRITASLTVSIGVQWLLAGRPGEGAAARVKVTSIVPFLTVLTGSRFCLLIATLLQSNSGFD